MIIPTTIERRLMSAFRKGKVSFHWPSFFEVDDIASKWLCKNLGLTTDMNETITKTFTFRFCWVCQKWMVK
jgi:hypothetical protein